MVQAIKIGAVQIKEIFQHYYYDALRGEMNQDWFTTVETSY
jgi:hypothetical protein